MEKLGLRLALRDLEEFGDIEEELTLFVLRKILALIEKENDFVQKINALFFFELPVIKDTRLLNQSRLVQVRICIFVFYKKQFQLASIS